MNHFYCKSCIKKYIDSRRTGCEHYPHSDVTPTIQSRVKRIGTDFLNTYTDTKLAENCDD